jgi:uncharacterized membrane protein
MIGARCFLRASDTAEHGYIEDYVSRGAVETVKNLKRGEALLHSSEIPGVKFYVRAPFSMVKEPSPEQIGRINRRHEMRHATLNNEAIIRMFDQGLNEHEARALALIRNYHEAHDGAILAGEIERQLGFSTGTRQRTLTSLVEKKLVKKMKIRGMKGRPSDGFIPLN